jgi:hypothetical protein
MLVFGDAPRRERPADVLDRVRARLLGADDLPAGVSRHGELVSALIEAGQLAQGLADADGHAAGDRDVGSPAAEAAMALTMKIAASCAASWSTGFAERGEACGRELARCAERLPSALREFKQPEGYAHYLLYPESYLEAAWQCARGRWQVIGVRSIGTSLACMVAVALDAPVPITVRPIGHPFDRRIDSGHQAIDREAACYAVVDEGPGLSGTSVAAVVEWLREAGIDERRVHLFASHRNGPGKHASPAAREVWRRAQAERRVHCAGFDEVVLESADPVRRLETWVAQLVGPLRGPLCDIGGGKWRLLQQRPAEEALPPVHPWQEPRKFLAESGTGSWLVKFAGLGSIGQRKLERARTLAGAGFTPEPLGLCHGFLVERWRGDAVPLPEHLDATARQELLVTVGKYLGFRARVLVADAGSGASMHELYAMARANTEQAIGADRALAWNAWQPHLELLESMVSRADTDNRLHRWEWLLAGASGVILKADALDHAFGHDLVGSQDIAWDIAGASIELC